MKEVIKWVMEGRTPKLSEVQGKVQEVRQLLFNPMLFVIHNGVLYITDTQMQPSLMMHYGYVYWK